MKRATCYIIAAGEHYSAPSEPDSGDMVIAATADMIIFAASI